MAARPPVGSESDLLFEFLRYQARDAATLEAQRLLYVACTRAKCAAAFDRCTMTKTATSTRRRQPRSWTRLPEACWRALWPVSSAEFELARTPLGRPPAAPAAPRGGRLKRLPLEWPQEARHGAAGGGVLSLLPGREAGVRLGWRNRAEGREPGARGIAGHGFATDEAAIRAREGHFSRWLARTACLKIDCIHRQRASQRRCWR